MSPPVRGGVTLWFTGLPCSGKTTIARHVEDELKRQGVKVERLDGDELRTHFSTGMGFSRCDRSAHVRRVAYVCHLLTKHGVTVLAALVSPYREDRDYARQLLTSGTGGTGRFIEVFVDCPLAVCMQRDVKGLYQQAVRGEVQQFTGISDPYEPPLAPEVVLHTDRESPHESAAKLLTLLKL